MPVETVVLCVGVALALVSVLGGSSWPKPVFLVGYYSGMALLVASGVIAIANGALDPNYGHPMASVVLPHAP